MLLPRFDTSSIIFPELIQAANRLSSQLPHMSRNRSKRPANESLMAGTAEEKRQTDEKNAKGLLEFRVSNRQVFHRYAERTGVRLQQGQQRLDIYRTLPLEATPQCPTLTNNDATFLDEVNPLSIRLVRIWRSLRES